MALVELGTFLQVEFDSASYPSADELAGWTLVLGGKELPFADATPVHATTPYRLKFTSYDPNWAAGGQLLVSIRTEDVQNRYGQVILKARRSTTVGDNGNIVYGKTHYTYPRQPDQAYSYARGDGRFGRGYRWDLQGLRVTTDKTGDTDPVWITATFRAPNQSDAWTGYWEGQFDDFHTLFIRWIYHEGGVGKGVVTYTLPLRAAATEGGIQRSRSGRDVSFTWVRTYKEFQRRHLDLANHSDLFADMLAPPKPSTARSTTSIQNTGSQHGLYTPAPTVTSVEFTSNPGDDQTYGPGDVIQATLTFDQEVTVRYADSKRQAASLELEMNGETRTAYYERTDGKKVIFEYTVLPGDEAPVALKLPLNSLKLFSERGRQDGSIRNSEGTDAVLDHNGILSTKHRVDAVDPEFSSAHVSTDGAQVMVTLTEDIKSPSILRAFGLQTGLLQSLALDVWVDGELPVRSDATVSGDTVTLTMSEPITQGQTVTVSYDNLFTNHSGSRNYVDIPVYLKGRDGQGDGIGRRQCTTNYKIRPIRRRIREMLGLRPRQRVPAGTSVELWLGISTDEAIRIKDSRDRWMTNRYPLIEAGMSRSDCADWWAARYDRSLERSACVACPFQSRQRWVEAKRRWPELFAEAVEIDANLREGLALDKTPYLHMLRMPLAEAVALDEAVLGAGGQADGFGNECEGHCGV